MNLTIKTPPHSIEAEQMIIASILLDEQSLSKIENTTIADHFYRKEHQIIFKHIVALSKNKRNIDAITLALSLEQSNELEYIGGHEYLNDLVSAIPSSSNIKSYAESIRERYVLRELIDASAQVSEIAYSPQSRDINEILTDATQQFISIAENNSNINGFQIQYMPNVIDMIIDVQENKPEQLDTDDENLNLTLNGGLQRGELCILAGKSGMGKTSYAINLFSDLSTKHKCLFFSLEMSAKSITCKLYSNLTQLKVTDAHSPEDHERFATQSIIRKNMAIVDNPRITLQTLKSYIHQYKQARGGLDVIFIDYLQLITRDAKLKEYEALCYLTRELKLLAKEANIAIVCLSQVNRGNADRKEKRLLLSDLRGSGSIEQDADIVMFVHREEYYYHELGRNIPAEISGMLELTIAKFRRFNPSKLLYKADLGLNTMKVTSYADARQYSNFLAKNI